MINKALAAEVKKMTPADRKNIAAVYKGNVGSTTTDVASIEIEYKEPKSIESYMYYERFNDRDADYEKLEAALKTK